MNHKIEPATYFTSLQCIPASPGSALGFPLACNLCGAVYRHIFEKRGCMRILDLPFDFCHINRTTSSHHGFSMLFRKWLDHEESIIVSTRKAPFVHSTPLDHRLRCLRKHYHSRHMRAHQLRYGATAIH